jgi:hypothetical protein
MPVGSLPSWLLLAGAVLSAVLPTLHFHPPTQTLETRNHLAAGELHQVPSGLLQDLKRVNNLIRAMFLS